MSVYAYADPPYLGCGKRYVAHHADALVWDDPATHRSLVGQLVDGYPDGWVLSLNSTTLHTILPMCPPDVRVCAWVKTFAAFKVNVNPAYVWEPVILRGGRARRSRSEPTVRDWLAEPITLQKGLPGAKPDRFCLWVLDLLGFEDGDELVDLFPGTGSMQRAVTTHQARFSFPDSSVTQQPFDLGGAA